MKAEALQRLQSFASQSGARPPRGDSGGAGGAGVPRAASFSRTGSVRPWLFHLIMTPCCHHHGQPAVLWRQLRGLSAAAAASAGRKDAAAACAGC